MKKSGFTLIELLVVIAIIAILAAILFPVFAAAREKARMTVCASNLKQLSLAVIQYSQDYDELYPSLYDDGWAGGTCCGCTPNAPPAQTNTVTGTFYGGFLWSTHGGGQMWMDIIYPYVKSTGVYVCPSYPITVDTGGQPMTTYGYSTYLSPTNLNCEGLPGYNVSKVNFPEHCVMIADTVRYDYPYLDQGPEGNGESWGSYPWIGTSNFQFYGTAPACYAIPTVSREGAHNGGANIAFCDGHVKWFPPPGDGLTLFVASRDNATCQSAAYTQPSQYWYLPTTTLTSP